MHRLWGRFEEFEEFLLAYHLSEMAARIGRWRLEMELAFRDSRFAHDVMLVDRTIAKKVFWEFDSISMQNLTDILLLFCSPIWLSHHLTALYRMTHLVISNSHSSAASYSIRYWQIRSANSDQW